MIHKTILAVFVAACLFVPSWTGPVDVKPEQVQPQREVKVPAYDVPVINPVATPAVQLADNTPVVQLADNTPVVQQAPIQDPQEVAVAGPEVVPDAVAGSDEKDLETANTFWGGWGGYRGYGGGYGGGYYRPYYGGWGGGWRRGYGGYGGYGRGFGYGGWGGRYWG